MKLQTKASCAAVVSTMLLMYVSCKTTRSSSIKDLTPYNFETSEAIRLPLIANSLDQNSAKASLVAIEQFDVLPAPGSINEAYAFFSSFKDITPENAGFSVNNQLGAELRGTHYQFRFPGKGLFTYSQEKIGSPPALRYSDLQMGWKHKECPVDLDMNRKIFLKEYFLKYPDRKLSIIGPSKVSTRRIAITKQKMRVDFYCTTSASQAPENTKFSIYIRGTYDIKFDAPIFAVEDTDPTFSIMRQGLPPTENNGYGTRYNLVVNDLLHREPHPKILYWNLLKNKIIIEDEFDSNGAKIDNDYRDGIKSAVNSLGHAYPPFKNRIVLRSDIPQAKPFSANVVFQGHGSLSPNAGGEASMIYDDANGEMRYAGIAFLENEYEGSPRRSALQSLGLVDDASKDKRYGIKNLVLHELGHVLGLRHNFLGYGVDAKGQPWINSIMSYANLIPSQYLAYSDGYLEHDILSLRYLYAYLDADPERVRAESLAKLMKLPLSREEISDDAWTPEEHYCQAARFLQTADIPKLIQFRRDHPNFKKIFEDDVFSSYGKCDKFSYPTIER